MIKLEIDTSDLTKQILKLAGFNKIAEAQMRKGVTRGIKLMATEWRRVAPVASGRYKGAIKGKVKRVSGLEVFGLVGAKVDTRGFPYPRMLEYSRKHHYRSTSRAGSATSGQAKKAVDSTENNVLKELGRALDNAAKKMIVGK